MKLFQKLNYYFGDKYNDLIDKRIFAITGDITEIGFGLNQEEILNLSNLIDIVINTAANVSHYGNYNDFYNTNVKSVKNMIDFCLSFKKKLYHISTTSVSGKKLDKTFPQNKNIRKYEFNESCLYVGQVLENVYTRSKFEAESFVLDAISKGLDGYILRLGNLMPRYKDGIFQENISANAFVNRMIAFIKLGAIPEYILKESLEFTPIDYAAKAIYRIMTHVNRTNRVFHIYNQKYVSTKKIIKATKKLDYKIKVVSEKEFKKMIRKILKNEDAENILENLINDLDNDLHLDYKIDIIIKSRFSTNYLRRVFFKWPRISEKYIIRLLRLIDKNEN